MIDWSQATDDELAELYDALHERNDRLSNSIDTIHIRINGERMRKKYAFQHELLAPSYSLAESVMEEIKRRRRVHE